jgi:hypothetical protein
LIWNLFLIERVSGRRLFFVLKKFEWLKRFKRLKRLKRFLTLSFYPTPFNFFNSFSL